MWHACYTERPHPRLQGNRLIPPEEAPWETVLDTGLSLLALEVDGGLPIPTYPCISDWHWREALSLCFGTSRASAFPSVQWDYGGSHITSPKPLVLALFPAPPTALFLSLILCRGLCQASKNEHSG